MNGLWNPVVMAVPEDVRTGVSFTGDAGTASSGMGEPGSVPTAAAIANAAFDASGLRLRTLPLRLA